MLSSDLMTTLWIRDSRCLHFTDEGTKQRNQLYVKVTSLAVGSRAGIQLKQSDLDLYDAPSHSGAASIPKLCLLQKMLSSLFIKQVALKFLQRSPQHKVDPHLHHRPLTTHTDLGCDLLRRKHKTCDFSLGTLQSTSRGKKGVYERWFADVQDLQSLTGFLRNDLKDKSIRGHFLSRLVWFSRGLFYLPM